MDTRVLIVGLGGIGSEIVSMVEKIANKSLRTSLQFAVVDTDINTLGRIKRSGFGGKMIQLSDDITVEECLASDPEHYQRWFMENNILANKPMTEGAGQIRCVSRLAFELAVAKGKLRPLEKSVDQLYLDTDRNIGAALRIIVVSSLAGGTGSGLIIPVTRYLRAYLSDRLSQNSVIVRGVFLTADCFFSIMGSEHERKSLAGNAYAAVKELDAFTKRADGYLPSLYNKVFLDDNNEKTLICDYYYLFSAKNERSLDLASFRELKEYIVYCIYIQVLSPIQELNNSIEDNILKSTMTVETDKTEFKRYCASGIQILRYPYAEILEYLALEKAGRILSNEWMAVDLAYEKEKEKHRKRMEEGDYTELIDIGTFMIRYIATGDPSDPFVEKMRMTTSRQEDGKQKNTWDLYLEGLEQDINRVTQELLEEYQGVFASVEQKTEALKPNNWPVRSNVEKLMTEFGELFKQCSKLVRDTAEGGFGLRYFQITRNAKPEPCHFEYWCKDKNEFIHLSAVRYLLYHVIEEMEKAYRTATKSNEKVYRKLFLIKEIALLEDYEIDGSLSSIGQIERDVSNRLSRISKSKDIRAIFSRKAISRVRITYENGLRELEEYCSCYLYEKVLEEGLEYFKKLSQSLEEFYNGFRHNQEQYKNRQEKLRAQWEQSVGTPVHYICASPEYIENLMSQVTDIRRDETGNRRLSEKIFHQLKFAGGRGEKSDFRELDRIYQQDIPEFWKDRLETEYGHILDLNIIDAVVREGEYQGIDGYTYLEKRLDTAWENTIPKLLVRDSVQGQERHFCLYHESVESMEGRFKSLIHAKLMEKGGCVSSEKDSRYTITFYKVIYNLSASDISEFSVGKPVIDAAYPSGYSFRSYHDILKLQNKTKLTPHLDKNWSSIFNMPDINGQYTEIRIKEVFKALFLAWQGGSISVESKENPDRFVYKQDRDSIRGTLWQLAQELACRQEMIDGIFKETDERLAESSKKGHKLKQTDFWDDINRNQNKKKTIWTMPLKLLEQEPRLLGNDYLIDQMVEAVMEQVRTVIGKFCGLHKTLEEIGSLVKTQFLMLTDSESGLACQQAIRSYLKRNKMYDIDRQIRWEREGQNIDAS